MATGTSSKQQQREGSPAAEALRDEAEGPLQRPLPQVPPSGGSSEAQAARESPRFSRKELQDLGAKDVSDGPENQALHTPWTFWFDRSPRGSRAQDFFANLRSLCTVRTIKAFWCAFNNLRGVDDLEERESYHLMRDTRRPVWEDSDKVDGGMWTFKCRKSESATLWVELLVAAVGEQFSASVAEGDEVIGISVRIRGYDKNTFQIWNQSADMASKATVMQRAKELMPGAELIDTFYQSNTERLKESLLRPTTFYPTRGPPSHPFYPPSSSLRPHHAPHHHHHHQSHFRPPQQFPPPVLLNPAGLGVFMAPTATGTAVAATGVHGGLGGPITPATMTLTRPHTQEEQSPLQATQVSGVPLTPATKPAPHTHTQQKQEQEKQEEKQIPLQTQVGGGSVLTEKAAEAELTTSRDQGGGGIRREGGAVEERSPDPHHHHSSHHPHPHHHHPHRSAHHHHHRGQPTPSPPDPHHPYPHPPPPHAHQHHHHHSPPPPPQQHHTTK